MTEDLKEDYLKQHYDNYKNGIMELIKNNSFVLFDDIVLLVKKPPLDSMDSVRNRFLEIAKKYGIILNTDELNQFLDSYRSQLLTNFEEIKEMRVQSLNEVVSNYKEGELITIYKKDFTPINKKIRNYLKDLILSSFDNSLVIYRDKLINNMDQDTTEVFFTEIIKYIKGNYQKQFLDSFDIKILVKDTTLMNSIKEHNEHYTFTLNNSRVLNL